MLCLALWAVALSCWRCTIAILWLTLRTSVAKKCLQRIGIVLRIHGNSLVVFLKEIRRSHTKWLPFHLSHGAAWDCYHSNTWNSVCVTGQVEFGLIWSEPFNSLRPSGNYMNRLLWQSVMLRFLFVSFFMALNVNSDYFLKQH